MQKLREKLKNKKGFTLVEMIVVLAIIGILIALVAPNVARIIKDGQETADSARAKNFMTAAQAYATRNVAAGRAIVLPAANQYPGTNVYTIALDSTNLDGALTTFFSVPGTGTPPVPADKDRFIAPGGVAYFTPNDLKGSDTIYLYMTRDGAVMGAVYASGTIVKGVAGVSPGTGVDFSTTALRDGTIATTGVIAPPTTPTP
ncbi:prepilin-type N-terminal cleavage/methylation domain-containing protein [Robinsoniella peoriensis]|uniref:Prepilin-type N-terminal cleavage/methylation domain-containing protein n=1 Tax=Robinsoniella peoriensis TaxID=180332 RepID=A0A4U8Q950_9FIRM|nr:prepilin-type N-terminal cleavage/methylation domain-containing protein [Robinsoniella peoriensis]MDU7029887.1 prepilin-type N-terminal cleavage/methylation domain-containing protein [Clostridiales bacterium]TLD01437.1 hypothetical protein DSM106044_01657 [Robinsoniella peoriensis]